MSRVKGRRAPDLLRVPVLGRFLRWRHARSVLQATCFGLAVLIILDGLFGPQVAPQNLAGVIPWVHWRGFVVLALLVAGNLFCMACPFMLSRRLAKRWFPAGWSWPAPLQSKWLAVGLLLVFFWAYEAFSLWSSPWLTAWVAITYFVLAFVIDAFFRGAAFCRWVCPIGQFHFVNSMVSPMEVEVRDPEVCGECRTKDCIRGRYEPRVLQAAGRRAGFEGRPIRPDGPEGALALAGTPAAGRAFGQEGLLQSGCELALFQPRKVGNLDCTFCMECIHACPHENVGIRLRSPLRDVAADRVRSGVGRLRTRPDMAALALLLVFAAFLNAFGMVEPVFRLQATLAGSMGIESRALLLALFFLVGLVVLPAALTAATALASRRWSRSKGSVLENICTHGWGLVPLGLGMWTAHYLYHFLVGGLTLVPVVQNYLSDLGVPSGNPRWGLGPMVPESWLLPVEVLTLQGGLLLTLAALYRIARREEGRGRGALGAFLPWAVLATLLSLAGLWLLQQPMEMRGTFMAA